ncbi:Dynamin-like GTPase that mediates homotypic ER fusion [Kappamyces sp. JEL0680]|nr:Dynamin-like GTPase that mediates homotypic ER fusion [Kappamyces sp. JEL0680]
MTFIERLRRAETVAVRFHQSLVDASCLEKSNWATDADKAEVVDDIKLLVSQKQKDELIKISSLIEKSLSAKLSEPTSVLLSDSKESTWKDIMASYEAIVDETKAVLVERLHSIGLDETAIAAAVTDLRIQSWNQLLQTIRTELSDSQLLEKLRRRQDFNIAALTMITTGRHVSIKERFAKEADSMYLEAKRATVKSKAEIPYWFIMLTIALGWNEFVAILRNPMLTLMLLVSAAVTYLIFYTNMGGPVLQIAKATVGEMANQAKDQLKLRGVDTAQIGENIRNTLYANKVSSPTAEEIELKKRE